MITPDRVLLVTRTELRRRFRRRASGKRGSLGLLLETVAWIVAAVFCCLTAYGIGRYADASSLSLVDGTRQFVGLLWVTVFLFVSLWVVRTPDLFVVDTGLVTSVPFSDAVLGTFFARSTVPILSVFVPAASGAIGFGFGLRSLVLVPAATGSVLLTVVSSALLAILVAGAVRALVREFVRPHTSSSELSVVAMVMLLVLIASGVSQTSVSRAGELVGGSPLGWYADLFWLSQGGSLRRAVATAGGTLAFLPVFLLSFSWLSAVSTFRDTPRSDSATGTSTDSSSIRSTSITTPLSTILVTKWTRAIRRPLKMWYVLYPLMGLYFPVKTIVETGSVPSYVPLLIVLYGPWAMGGVLSLNVLGDEQSARPLTLISVPRNRLVFTANVLAGCLPGVPIFLSLLVLSGLATGTGLAQLVGYALLCIGFGVMAASVATACGLLFPKFEESHVTRKTTVIVPSPLAFVTYGLVYVAVAVPILVVLSPTLLEVLVDLTGLSARRLVALASGWASLSAIAATTGSAWYSVSFLENHTVDVR
ncbi:hypothetical protein [Haloterrigena salinisoli]|uniref:hypothetical protein n=1 Tax=Haloterrigena salinisoli TaxID=3132747 RepID=UPI0030CDBA2C